MIESQICQPALQTVRDRRLVLRPNRLPRRQTLREKRNSLRPSLSSLYADFINRAIIIVMFYTPTPYYAAVEMLDSGRGFSFGSTTIDTAQPPLFLFLSLSFSPSSPSPPPLLPIRTKIIAVEISKRLNFSWKNENQEAKWFID